jgi:hypothetical protein
MESLRSPFLLAALLLATLSLLLTLFLFFSPKLSLSRLSEKK